MSTGKKIWAIPGLFIPLQSTGEEPEFTSHEKIAVLNLNNTEAKIKIYIYYEKENPIGPFELKIKSHKMRKIRFNDLINPQAIELEKNFGCIIKSDIPVVVQHSRMETSKKECAWISTIAFAVKE